MARLGGRAATHWARITRPSVLRPPAGSDEAEIDAGQPRSPAFDPVAARHRADALRRARHVVRALFQIEVIRQSFSRIHMSEAKQGLD